MGWGGVKGEFIDMISESYRFTWMATYFGWAIIHGLELMMVFLPKNTCTSNQTLTKLPFNHSLHSF